MKLGSLFLTASLAAVALTTSAFADQGRYVILMKNNSVPADLEAKVAAAGGTLVRTIPQVGIAIATSSDASFASKAKGIKGVQSAGLQTASTLPATTDAAAPEAGGAAYSDAGLLWGIDRVGAPAAWANGHTGSHDTVIAIIDTGIAWNHPDLASNVVYVDCFTSAGSFGDGGCNPYPSQSDHGTHTAGTAAANFGGGVVGVAPEAGLAGYNVFESIPGCGVCAYSDSRWMAMVDAADRGFQVESMSLGGVGQYGYGNLQDVSDLATYVAAEKRIANYVNSKGTVMVASAGNEQLNTNGTIVHVPGDIPQMINVSATGVQPLPRWPQDPAGFDILAFYSNYGAAVTVAAPGGDCGQIGICDPATRPANWFEYLILSTVVAPNAACAATYSCPVGYGWKGGTSMATPHVAGVAALIMDADPSKSPNQVEAKIKQSAENIGSRQEFGHGMVRADLATE